MSDRNLQLQAEQQLAWIEKQLVSSVADWLIVVGHYPVYSVSYHGPTRKLVDSLLPMMEKTGVAGYFAGHDHDLQHISVEGSCVDHYLSGAGAKISSDIQNKIKVPTGSLKFNWPSEGM